MDDHRDITSSLCLRITMLVLLPLFPTVLSNGCGKGQPKPSPNVVATVPTAPSVPAVPAIPLDGHQRMVALLREVHQQMDRHPDYGEARLREARMRLASAEARRDVEGMLQWNYFVAEFALRFGRNEEAIQHFQTALELLPEARKSPSFKMPPGADEEMLYFLAVANLRRGEADNCIHCQTGESCILPIRGEGLHQHPTGSQAAITHLSRLLEKNPDHLKAIWLLNIAHMTLGTYPDEIPESYLVAPEKFASAASFPEFANVAHKQKLDTMSLLGGTIADDFDGDGWLDLVVSSSATDQGLRFFHNNGDGTFVEQTAAANLAGIVGGCNLIQADYDNDGDLDVLVLRGGWMGQQIPHPNSLLQNDGQAKFKDVTFDAGLGEVHYPTHSAAWADYDNDGDLDLYVGNEVAPSQLFQNDGGGHFRDVARSAKVTNDRFAKGVVWGDYDGDRFPDLFVSNYRGANRVYRNTGNGSFQDVASDLKMTHPTESFPLWLWDFNNDGALDLYIASFQMDVGQVAAEFLDREFKADPDRLFQGDGQGQFSEVARQLGMPHVSQPMGVNFGDLDNDGYLDFYLGTGYPEYEALMPNLMYRNDAGRGFVNVTYAGGFGHLQKGHGVAFADFDHDGDQDVFIEMGGAYLGDQFQDALFENPGFGNHWIKIKLVGEQSNRSAIGARIWIDLEEDGQPRSIYRWIGSGGSFGANPLREEIGIGRATVVKVLEVYWPTTDTTQRFQDIGIDQLIEIHEGAESYQTVAPTPPSP